jgi:hypothetical protein
MHHTANQAARLATSKAKAAIAMVDAKFVSIPSPPVLSPSMTPGEMLVAVTRAGDFSPQALAMRTLSIKRELQSKMSESDAMIEKASKTADAFAELADFLQGKSTVVPNGLPQPVADAARTVKRAAESGLYQPKPLADEVRRHATAALLTLADSKKTLSRVKSAGQVAFQHRAWKAYTKAATDSGYSYSDRKRLALSQHRYEASYLGGKRKHAERFFDEVEMSKTYRGIEMKHTGVEVGR